MDIVELTSNLSSAITDNFPRELSLDHIVLNIIHGLAVFLLNIVSYFYVVLKFFKTLCYTRLTLEWFPLINPYVWPFSIIQTLTNPYFSFWERVLPNIRFEKSSLEISSIIALESLNSVTFFVMIGTQELIHLLTKLELVYLKELYNI